MNELTRKIESIKVTQAEIDNLTTNVNTSKKDLETFEGDWNQKVEEENIQSLEIKKRKVDDSLSELSNLMKKISLQNETNTKLSIKRKDMAELEDRIQKMFIFSLSFFFLKKRILSQITSIHFRYSENQSEIEKIAEKTIPINDLDNQFQSLYLYFLFSSLLLFFFPSMNKFFEKKKG